MASAEDYANWIVANQDKKGTPEFDTVAQAYKVARQQAPSPRDMSWKDVGQTAFQNLPESFGNVLGGIAETVTSPVKTLSGISDLMQGGLSKVIPQSMQDPNAQPAVERGKLAGTALRDFYKNRYGSEQGLKEALATDPAGVMADVSTLVTGYGGAGSALAKGLGASPKYVNAYQKVAEFGKNIDPLTAALKGTGAIVGGVGTLGKKAAGVMSGAGEEALTQAYKAGQTGGQRGETFVANMRGEAPMTDVLEGAKANLAEMGRQKQVEYRANMANIKSDKTILDLTGIDSAIANADRYASYKGQVVNTKAADVLAEIKAKVDHWKTLDPAEYHTPEGLDQLKQSVWDSIETIPDNAKTANSAAKEVYNAIKAEVSKQAPTYAKTMKEYSDASDQIKEIEKALSLGHKASVDTAMRKLQSLMRNNANTNYGYRTQLAQQLEQAGGHEMMPALAGQALNKWTPRGIQGATTGLSGLAAYSVGGAPLTAADLALSSPRLMGETAYKGGQLSRGIRNLSQKAKLPLNAANIDPRVLANYLYQINPQGQQ